MKPNDPMMDRFIEHVSISHADSGYSFKQDNERVRVVLGGTTIAFIAIPEAWYSTTHIDPAGLKVLAVEWLKENWEGK